MKLSGLFTSKILLRPFMPQSPFLKQQPSLRASESPFLNASHLKDRSELPRGKSLLAMRTSSKKRRNLGSNVISRKLLRMYRARRRERLKREKVTERLKFEAGYQHRDNEKRRSFLRIIISLRLCLVRNCFTMLNKTLCIPVRDRNHVDCNLTRYADYYSTVISRFYSLNDGLTIGRL